MFESPLFLLAALLGAMIPLILHLMQKQRSTPDVFPTLRFLKLAQHASSRRIRIEHLLLWLLRTLIMLLLGLAFSMPIIRSSGWRLLGQASRDVAIVVDASYSMAYQQGRESTWDRAVAMATSLINGLGDNDRYCLYLAREEPLALVAEPVTDKSIGVAQLGALSWGHHSSRLEPAIAAAHAALRRAPGRRQLELHVITDRQAVPWSTQPSGLENLGEEKNLAVFVSMPGPDAPENTTPTHVDIVPPIMFARAGGQLLATVLHQGPPRATTVSFHIGEQEVARRTTGDETTEDGRIEFAIPPLPPGVHAARLETPEDNLRVDDAFHFLLRVRDELPALVVGDEPDTFFLRAALRAAGEGISIDWIRPAELDARPLSGYACIYLCNALPLPGQALDKLDRFARQGGVLAIFPGLRARPEDYQAWRGLPGIPAAVRDVPRAQSSRTLAWANPNHPVLRGMDDALSSPVITLQRILTWESRADDAIALIMAGENDPLLLERPAGLGRILMFGVGADRAWSNFPLTPFYLPVIIKLLEYHAHMEASPPYLLARDAIPLATIMPDAPAELVLTDPGGRPVGLRGIIQDGESVRIATPMREPGIYEADGPDGRTPVAAVNLDRAESNLEMIDPDAISKRLPLERLYFADNREELDALLQEHRIGRTYGEALLWLVLLLAVVEFVYANQLARATGRGGAPATTPSGRITTTGGAT